MAVTGLTGIIAVRLLLSMAYLHLWHTCTCGMPARMACLHPWHACTYGSYGVDLDQRRALTSFYGMPAPVASLHVWHACTYGMPARMAGYAADPY